MSLFHAIEPASKNRHDSQWKRKLLERNMIAFMDIIKSKYYTYSGTSLNRTPLGQIKVS